LNTRGKEAAALALHRFGFGALRDSITAIAADPRGALLSDLDRPGAGFLAVKLPSSAAAARAVSDFRAEEQAKSKLAQRAKKEAEAMGMASASDAAASTLMLMPKPSEPPLPQQIFQNEAAARYEAAAGADIGFVGSGRTISASRPTKISPWSAPTSARRSAPTCLGASPTC